MDSLTSNPVLNSGVPEWATGCGEDQYGVFLTISLETGEKYWDFLEIKLRWIPPGEFMMGSPDDEPGRYEDEGPQHRVKISSGFWMMDTAVTQGLYTEVMKENPSHFQEEGSDTSQRPVESVDWHMAKAFCEGLRRRTKLWVDLPTEAQWEYACRAGTEGAIYRGDFKIVGINNAPSLSPIAWYAGNSGDRYELTKHVDSSGWREKEMDHQKAGTRIVAQKLPNSLGLFDTLGNVLEWCEDGLRTYEEQDELDPQGNLDSQSMKALKGGGWVSNARYVRAASRYEDGPDLRDRGIGFRCIVLPSEPERLPASEGRAQSSRGE